MRNPGSVWCKASATNCGVFVLGWIDSYDSNQILFFLRFFEIYKTIWLYFQEFPKFSQNQRFSQKSTLFLQKSGNFAKILLFLFLQNFATFSKNQLDSFVDLEKPEKMRIWLQNFVSIQPRTSLEKSDVSWPTAQYLGSV